MENEQTYSREVFEKIEEELREMKEKRSQHPDDPSWDEDIEALEAKRERLLDLAHEEALDENGRRDRQGELPLE